MNKLSIYTYGGWSFRGTVKKADKVKLTVALDDGRNAVVFKKYIVAMVDDEALSNKKTTSNDSSKNNNPLANQRKSLLEEENQRTSFIPEDMLIGGSSSNVDDFSISFSKGGDNNMIFKLEGEDE